MKHQIKMQVFLSVSPYTYLCVKVVIAVNSSTHNLIHYKNFSNFELKIVFWHPNPETNV